MSVVLILGGLLTAATTLAAADVFDATRNQIRDVMVQENVSSVAVAVAHNGKIVWEEGFGFADDSRRVPATAHTLYSLASISKPVTATALMILIERGKIDLDKPLNDYLGGQKLTVHVGESQPTVRQVANHTSGLPLHYQFFYEDESASRPTMEESIRRYGTLVRAPGEAFSYSNFGYGVLEYVIERVSGKSYAQFLDDELFGRLGLTESSVNRSGRGPMAVRYRNGHAVPFYDFDHRGASAVFMSAHDLVRFGMLHLGHFENATNAVLKRETLAAMVDKATMVPVGDDEKTSYGIGWFIDEQHGLRAIGHNGGMAGVSTTLTLYPDADVAIAVVSNGNAGGVYGLESSITHALLPDTVRHDHGFKPDGEMVGKWKGALHTYVGQVAVELEFQENGSTFAKVGSRPLEEVTDVKLDTKSSLLTLGGVTGDVGTPDATRYPYQLSFTLKRREPDTLNGAVSAVSRSLPDRVGNGLSYWVELKKVAAKPDSN